jgi:hypothetical protein
MNAGLSKDIELGRSQSVQAAGTHTWLTVTPKDHFLRLTDQEYRTCAEYRLGAHIMGMQDLTQCPCCKRHQPFVYDPWHFLSCPNIISNEGTARHNNISLYIKTRALNGGCFARYEPRELSQDDHKRPDVELFILPASTLIDVVVSNSLAPSHAKSATTNL